MPNDNAISREKRSLPPADFTLKVESFSTLAKSKVDKFESNVFKAGGYNWKLVFYPNGHTSEGRNHLSLYLKMDESNPHPDGAWSVSVYFRLFVLDQNLNQYLTVEDAKPTMRRFDRLRSEWGFAKFLDLATFKEPSNAYLLENMDEIETCVFGAEVYVIKPTGHEETLSLINQPSSGTYIWPISNFSTFGDKAQNSPEFTIGERSWQLVLYPAGTGADKGQYVTVALKLADYGRVRPKKSVYAQVAVQIPNQYSRNRTPVEKTIDNFFKSAAESSTSELLSMEDLYDSSKGYLSRADSLTVRVEFKIISVTTVSMT